MVHLAWPVVYHRADFLAKGRFVLIRNIEYNMADRRADRPLPEDRMDTEPFEPEILAFCCHYCAYAAADLAGAMRLSYPPSVKVIELPCSGRIDILHILHAFERGADGVFVAG